MQESNRTTHTFNLTGGGGKESDAIHKIIRSM